ncbi:MAG: hypothetical protein EHM32_05035 [Spirochaetales bacterium]|nr:MAG: hypothetical protein EHM32_05035 [Spirochaetales bacterium]
MSPAIPVLVVLVILSSCAHGTVSDNFETPAIAIAVVPGIIIDSTMLENSIRLFLNGIRAGSGVTLELCVYGHSRGRELFLYSGDEYSTVKNIEENMSIAVLVKIKHSGLTTKVLFAEASGQGDEQLIKNAAREIAAKLSAAGFSKIVVPNR